MTEREQHSAWLERYANAWRRHDLDLAADLFAEDVAYSFDPFSPSIRGRDAVVNYWRHALDGQRDLDLTVRLWSSEGEFASAEWWAAFERDGSVVTLSASLLLRFDDDGRCLELHEHWIGSEARRTAPPRFGN